MPRKYEEIYQIYKQKILSRELNPTDRLPSERKLAKDFGHSRITAKRALNELEKEGFIERIQGSGSYVTKNKWKKDGFLENTNGNLSIISLVLPFHDEFSSQILKGIEDVAKRKNFFVTFHDSKASPRIEKNVIEDIILKGAHGIILYPTQPFDNMELYSQLLIKKYPIVLIDRKIPGLEMPLVTVDNEQSFYNITDYLIKCGHKKIVFVAPEVRSVSSEYDRYRGFCKAHIDNNVSLMNKHLYSIEDIDDMSDDYRPNEPLDDRAAHFFFDIFENMKPEEKPTAIAAVNDLTAERIMAIAIKRDIKIPETFSVTGFDNLSFTSHLPVPLTTVSQPALKIGKTAASILFDLIASPDNGNDFHKINAKLIKRDSCAPPPKGT